MERIKEIKKLTDNRFLNLYEQDAVFRDGSNAPYYVASRRKSVEQLKSVTHDNHPDGVILYGVYGEEKDKVVRELKTGVEITRFKGLGEISSNEFVEFIGENMRLDRVKLSDEESIAEIMEFYMGDNTIERQNFIRTNLRSEAELEDVNI